MPQLQMQNLLWYTRGREWGFRYLHLPELRTGGWDPIYDSIFESDARIPRRWHGAITLAEGKPLGYVASRFHDHGAVWKDDVGREIPHEMLVILDSDATEEIAGLDWERVVMDYVRTYYSDQFSKDSAEVQAFGAESASLELPTQAAQCFSTRRDIEISGSQRRAKSDGPDRHMPLYEQVLQVLTTDVRVLSERLWERIRGDSSR